MERSLADGLLSRNPTTRMSSTATNNVKTAIPIFDGSNYNVWVDQMKFWLQSQNLWRIVNGTILRPTIGPGPPPVTAQDVAVWDDKDEAAFGAISSVCQLIMPQCQHTNKV